MYEYSSSMRNGKMGVVVVKINIKIILSKMDAGGHR